MAARRLKAVEQLPATSGWELLVRLAHGGMGAVYLATRRGTREPLYAIKRAHSHLLEEPPFRKMFVAEAELALKIQHPHAIGVRAVDESDGELLLVMDYFEGSSLGELIAAANERKVRLPTGVVLRIILDAARGLDAAHRLADEHGRPLGIVHRDVSPQNVLVGVGGASAIVDFGIAKAVAVETTRTATETLRGKYSYMAPEYLENRSATPMTDVFSLGIVAWEALTQRRLFKSDDEIATLRAIASADPAPELADLLPIDPTLSAIVARSLAKDPRERYASAREFADALEARATAIELIATRGEVAATMKRLLGEGLETRRALIEEALAERFGAVECPPSARITTTSEDFAAMKTKIGFAETLPLATTPLNAAEVRAGLAIVDAQRPIPIETIPLNAPEVRAPIRRVDAKTRSILVWVGVAVLLALVVLGAVAWLIR
jgi:eukaryotic-like serine/threonine-protein kinase